MSLAEDQVTYHGVHKDFLNPLTEFPLSKPFRIFPRSVRSHTALDRTFDEIGTFDSCDREIPESEKNRMDECVKTGKRSKGYRYSD